MKTLKYCLLLSSLILSGHLIAEEVAETPPDEAVMEDAAPVEEAMEATEEMTEEATEVAEEMAEETTEEVEEVMEEAEPTT